MTKEVELTVREFIENIRKNGLDKAQGSLFIQTDDVRFFESKREFEWLNSEHLNKEMSPIQYACAFGQGLINSNAAFDANNSPGNQSAPEQSLELIDNIYHATWLFNDNNFGASMGQVADYLLYEFEDDLDEVLTFPYFDYSPFLPENFQPRTT